MGVNRKEYVLALADAIHSKIPADLVAPGERASFPMAAAAILRRRSVKVHHDGSSGFGLESLTPEATQIAVLAADAAASVLLEAGFRGAMRKARNVVRGRRKNAVEKDDSDELKARTRTEVMEVLTEAGVEVAVAELYAQKAVEAVEQYMRGGLPPEPKNH